MSKYTKHLLNPIERTYRFDNSIIWHRSSDDCDRRSIHCEAGQSIAAAESDLRAAYPETDLVYAVVSQTSARLPTL